MKLNSLLFSILLLLLLSQSTDAQTKLWEKQYLGSRVSFRGAQLTPEGNSYLAGIYYGQVTFDGKKITSNGNYDNFVAKYDSSGKVLWAHGFGSIETDEVSGLALDKDENCYLTGYFKDTLFIGDTSLVQIGYYNDIFLAKYDKDGNFLWAKRFGGDYYDSGKELAIDNLGNVYLTGYFEGTAIIGGITIESHGNEDAFLAKLDPNGNAIWVKVAGSKYHFDYGLQVSVDQYSNSYFMVCFNDTLMIEDKKLVSRGSTDLFLVKYNSEGDFQWIRQFGGANTDNFPALTLDKNGNSYLSIYTSGNEIFIDSLSVSAESILDYSAKIDSDGNVVWIRVPEKSTMISAFRFYPDGTLCNSVKIDESVKYADYLFTHDSVSNKFWIKYDSEDKISSVKRLGNNDYIPFGIDEAGNFYSVGNPNIYDAYFFKYADFLTTTSVEDDDNLKPNAYSLQQNYPNPFNPTTMISFELPEVSQVELKIYNMLGQEVATLLNEEKQIGKHQIQFNASSLSSGIYLYKIKANDFVSVKKMMLVK